VQALKHGVSVDGGVHWVFGCYCLAKWNIVISLFVS